jgi:hypothetical protein
MSPNKARQASKVYPYRRTPSPSNIRASSLASEGWSSKLIMKKIASHRRHWFRVQSHWGIPHACMPVYGMSKVYAGSLSSEFLECLFHLKQLRRLILEKKVSRCSGEKLRQFRHDGLATKRGLTAVRFVRDNVERKRTPYLFSGF